MKESSEQQVKAVHPRAYAEKFKTPGGRVYYLIFTRPPHVGRLSEGKTKAAAWSAAARALSARGAQPADQKEEA